MRRKQNEIKDKGVIENILSKSEVCRIAIMDGDKPYIVPLNYGYYNNAIYVHSAPLGKKIDLLKINNKVCFEIEYLAEIIKRELPCDWGTKYRSVIGYGTVEIITDFDEKKKGLDIIMAHYGKPDNNVYKEKEVDFIVILKINIEEITGKQLGNWDE
jgi:nitroimidazol reductase NimA-like FMN-containing flavoprotein (pyridoxamine 5'-phosphate oxidase superfamily)